MKATVSSKGQIVIPAEIREQDDIIPGQQFDVQRIQSGEYLLKKIPAPGTKDVVDWLLECPHKGWFNPVALESESTDALIDEIKTLFDSKE
jgi:AbrB family looped-hinge helix DNA binding protein